MATATGILPPRYRSVASLGRGATADVYRAHDDDLGRDVAVKLLDERYVADEAFRARFTREALAAARLSGGPHVITIFDVGEWNERPYIVMELAGGGSVADRTRAGAVEPATALRWIEEAAGALDAAHADGVVHRDVKPANLLLAADGTVRVADFGIATAAGLASLTEPGTVLGTFGYLAPEQASAGKVGPAADRYALAVVAYELLTGRRPHEAAGLGAAEAIAAAGRPPPPVSTFRAGLPSGLDRVFARALDADPARRHVTCAELAAELRAAFDHADATTRVAPAQTGPVARVVRRRRVSPAAVLVLLLGAGAAGLGAAVLADRDTAPPTRTAAGRTVTVTEETVTQEAPTTAPAAPAEPPSGGRTGAELNDDGYRLMQAGDHAAALPLLEQAVRALAGTGSLAEAYALYNLAFTRFALGRCDGVAAMLTRSERIQGFRSEIVELRSEAARACG